MDRRNRRGAGGERAARDALTRAGMIILKQNYRRSTGEIDIIAREKDTLVFVEVKARVTLLYGHPAEAVNHAKQVRILRTAMLYMMENGLDDVPVRFDVVEVLPSGVRHIRNAFDATGLNLY